MKKFLTIFLLLTICSACENRKDPSLRGEALEFYEKADNGDSEAMNSLGNCYFYGKGGAYLNYEKAVYWYKQAAKNGNAAARCNLGYCFEIGRKVKQNYKKATELYRKAAEQGYAEAQYRLGYCFDESNNYDEKKNKFDLEHDPEQAFWWYHEAAENGYAEAQYKLGEIYSSYRGRDYGVSIDSIEAKNWYRKAANQGHEGAKKKLETQFAEETPSAPPKTTPKVDDKILGSTETAQDESVYSTSRKIEERLNERKAQSDIIPLPRAKPGSRELSSP